MAKQSNLIFETAFMKFACVGQIGCGGSGTVIKAQGEDGKLYAIKYLNPAALTTERVKRFKNELTFCADCDHKNIVRVLDWGFVLVEGTKCPFYVMRVFDGTLRTLMDNRIPASRVLPYFSQLLDGVEAAHLQDIWHRDLKPENVLYDRGQDTIVVADFGIARFSEPLLQTAIETSPHARMANFIYAAPEQRVKGNVDQRSDVYALGLMLNEMFTSTVPHGVNYTLIGSVAPEFGYLDDLVAAMLQQSPERRPQSIRKIKEELIARNNAFVEQQKLSTLKQVVIPASEVDHPLVVNPPTLVSARWENGLLTMNLSQKTNPLWAQCFARPTGNYSAYLGMGPEMFLVQGDRITIRCNDRDAQRFIDQAKEYIRMGNDGYRCRLEDMAKTKRQEDESALRQQIAIAEKHHAVNAKLRI